MKTTIPFIARFCFLLLGISAFAQNSAPLPGAAHALQTCFQCEGTGKMKCPTCQGTGSADCPGPCLKLSRGQWRHMQVAGHPDSDLWFTFHNSDGTTISYTQGHAGDVIKLQDGHWVDTGKCPVCGGTGKAKCRACDGSGKLTCTLCGGQGQVPGSWTRFDNPRMQHRPDRFVLKDGRTLLGRKVAMTGDNVTIRTESGDVEVAAADVVSEEHQATEKSK